MPGVPQGEATVQVAGDGDDAKEDEAGEEDEQQVGGAGGIFGRIRSFFEQEEAGGEKVGGSGRVSGLGGFLEQEEVGGSRGRDAAEEEEEDFASRDFVGGGVLEEVVGGFGRNEGHHGRGGGEGEGD